MLKSDVDKGVILHKLLNELEIDLEESYLRSKESPRHTESAAVHRYVFRLLTDFVWPYYEKDISNKMN